MADAERKTNSFYINQMIALTSSMHKVPKKYEQFQTCGLCVPLSLSKVATPIFKVLQPAQIKGLCRNVQYPCCDVVLFNPDS